MKNEKNVEFKPIKLSAEQSKQVTQVDDILTAENSVGNQKIVLVNMITETINSKKVKMEYTEINKKTGIEKVISFDSLNQITNKDVKGLADTYKKWLGVDKLKSWASTTDNGKERMRILKESLWVAIVTAKTDVITKNKKGEQFTGNKNSEVFIEGEFAKKYSPNPQHQKTLDQHSMKFSELKKASQNYYADKSTNLNTNETSGTDNSFVASVKKMTRTINASKGELVLKKEQAGTEQTIKHLEIACVQWIAEFNKVKQSSMTPEQIARLSKKAS